MSAVDRAAALRSEANASVPAALIALLRSVKRIWVVPHERPDGDALGAVPERTQERKPSGGQERSRGGVPERQERSLRITGSSCRCAIASW